MLDYFNIIYNCFNIIIIFVNSVLRIINFFVFWFITTDYSLISKYFTIVLGATLILLFVVSVRFIISCFECHCYYYYVFYFIIIISLLHTIAYYVSFSILFINGSVNNLKCFLFGIFVLIFLKYVFVGENFFLNFNLKIIITDNGVTIISYSLSLLKLSVIYSVFLFTITVMFLLIFLL